MAAESAKPENDKKVKSILLDARSICTGPLKSICRAATKVDRSEGASHALPRLLRMLQHLADASPSNSAPFLAGDLGRFYEENPHLCDASAGTFKPDGLPLMSTTGAHSTDWVSQREAFEMLRLCCDEEMFREISGNREFPPSIGSCGASAFVLIALLWAAEADAGWTASVTADPEMHLSHRSDVRAGAHCGGGTRREVRAKACAWVQFYLAISYFVPETHGKMLLELDQLWGSAVLGPHSALSLLASPSAKRDIVQHVKDEHSGPKHGGKLTGHMFFEFVQLTLGSTVTRVPPLDNPRLMVDALRKRPASSQLGRQAAPPKTPPPPKTTQAGSPPKTGALPQTPSMLATKATWAPLAEINTDFPPEAGHGVRRQCFQDWAKLGSCDRFRCDFRHTRLDGSTVETTTTTPMTEFQRMMQGGRGRGRGACQGRGRGHGRGQARGGHRGGHSRGHGRGSTGFYGRGREHSQPAVNEVNVDSPHTLPVHTLAADESGVGLPDDPVLHVK